MTGEAPSAVDRLAAWRPVRRRDLHEITLDAEKMVVYDPQTGSLHQLDRIGSMIWALLDGTPALAESLPGVAATFGVDIEVVAGDVVRLLEELDAQGLLAGG